MIPTTPRRTFLWCIFATAIGAQEPPKLPSRFFVRATAPPYCLGATVTVACDPALVQPGVHTVATKVESERFELCLPTVDLPKEIVVAWSPRVRQTFSLDAGELAGAVEKNADGSRQIEVALADDTVMSAKGGAAVVAPSGLGGRFAGRARGNANRDAIAEAAAALNRGIAWLVAHQEADGAWPATADGKRPAAEGRCAATAAACLTLMAGGNTFRSGPHSAALRRGLCWLVEQTDAKSGRVARPSPTAPLEEQAIVALTLLEAFGLARFEPLREAARAASEVLQPMLQDERVSDRRDACALGLTAMACVSAGEWVAVPTDALARAIRELEGSSADASPLRDAAAMLIGAFVGDQELRAVDRRSANLLANLPARGANLDVAYVYFGTYAMYQAGDPMWTPWRDAAQKALLADQQRDGDLAGSFPPSDPRAQMRGRAWTTAMRLLTIQSYIRYSRILQAGK